MGMRTYIRIDTESYTGCFAFGGSQFVNDFQFGYGLYVEAENIIIQTQINFPVCLAYTSIDYFVCRESGLNGCAVRAVFCKAEDGGFENEKIA